MGDQKSAINGRNDFYSYLYTTLSPRVTINGVTGKMIADKSGIDTEHPHLPAYANTCDIYFYPDKDKVAVQAKYMALTKRCFKISIGIILIKTKTSMVTLLKFFRKV